MSDIPGTQLDASALPSKRNLRQQERKEHRAQQKKQRRDEQDAIREKYHLPKGEATVWLAEPRFGAKNQPRLPEAVLDEIAKRELVNIRCTSERSHAAIPNPNHKPGTETPLYAAIRIADAVDDAGQQRLLGLISALEDTGVKFHTTAAHGKEFQQFWLGVWRKYAKVPRVTGDRRTPKAPIDTAIKALLAEVDSVTSKSPRRILAQADPTTAGRMHYGHQPIAKAAMRHAGQAGGGADQAWLDADPDRAKTSSFRMGGIGSVMALSMATGQGTAFHYDKDDDGHYYSSILVLGANGKLKLPEVGYEMEVKTGSMVFFLANQQYHRLTVEGPPGTKQVVLTFWTDKNAMDSVYPLSPPDFFDTSGEGVMPDSKRKRLDEAAGRAEGKGKGKAKATVDDEPEASASRKQYYVVSAESDSEE